MKNTDSVNVFKKGLINLEIDFSDALIGKFILYNTELLRWNKRFGFINTDDPEELYIHMLDALSGLLPLKQYGPPAPVLDLGSGAGLPGLPLAFCLPDIPFFLCERKAKEAAFLRNVVLLANISNVTVIEDIRHLPEAVGCAVFRAVKTIEELLPILDPHLKKNGIIFAYKATLARIADEMVSLEKKYRNIQVHQLKHPDTSRERHAVVLHHNDKI